MSKPFGKKIKRNPSSILRRLSIKHRLLVAFLITSLLPVVFVTIYSNFKYTESISNKVSASTKQTLTELARNISRELEQYETLSEFIIVNKKIQTGLSEYNNMSENERYQYLLQIREEISGQVFPLSNVFNVLIFTNDGQQVFDLGYETYTNDQLRKLTEEAKNAANNAHWTHLQSNRGTRMLALSRIIYSENNLERQIGHVIILIEEKVFSRNTYRHVDLGAGSKIYITDDTGRVVSSVSSSIQLGHSYAKQEIFEPIISGTGADSFYARIEGESMLVTSEYISDSNWYLIGLLPRSFLVSELSGMQKDIYLICLAALFFSGMVAMWIYISINTPMRNLLQYAKQIRLGQLDTKLAVTHADEMGKLAETIDQMVKQLKQLIYQVQTEQQAKRDAELKMLQAQINPHFLFNTLNSLKWSAMMSGSSTVTQGIESLSELLHNTILESEDLIPLEKEIGNLLHYATIQRIRYGDSFKLQCKMSDDALYKCLVPRFMLQPIVENSILHAGGEDGRRVGILVEGSKLGNNLRLSITDDGKGFDVEQVYARRTFHSKLSGIGIANVKERLNIYFGPSYGLELRSQVNKGTKTVITLPILKEKGEVHV